MSDKTVYSVNGGLPYVRILWAEEPRHVVCEVVRAGVIGPAQHGGASARDH